MSYKTHTEKQMLEQITDQKSEISLLQSDVMSMKDSVWHTQVELDTIDCGLVLLQRILMDFLDRGYMIEEAYDHITFLLDSLERYTHRLSERTANIAESEPYRILTSEAFELHATTKAAVEERQLQQQKAASAKSKGGK